MSEADYRGDVIYEVWRRGGNPDFVDYDRITDYYNNGFDSDHAADYEINALYPPRISVDEDVL